VVQREDNAACPKLYPRRLDSECCREHSGGRECATKRVEVPLRQRNERKPLLITEPPRLNDQFIKRISATNIGGKEE
jgi:hypothetical protein